MLGTGDDDAGEPETIEVFSDKEPLAIRDAGDATRVADANDNERSPEVQSREAEREDRDSRGSGDAADAGRGTGRARVANTDRDAGGADEDRGYSRRVRARIQRERATANRERALREQTQRDLKEERAARVAQEERIGRLERATQEVTGNSGVKDLERQIADLRPQIAAAMEAGDTAKTLELQDRQGDLKAKLEVMKYDLTLKARAAEVQAAARAKEAGRTAAGTAATGADDPADDPEVKAAVDAFVTANRHWWNRSKFKDAKADCINIERELRAEIRNGDHDFDAYSEEMWEELATRLHKEWPELELCDADGQDYTFDEDGEQDNVNQRDRNGRNGQNDRGRNDTRGTSPTGGIGKGARRQPSPVDLARQGKVTLTQEDFKQMRTYGLDPNKADDKKYFAKERMRTLLTQDRRGDR